MKRIKKFWEVYGMRKRFLAIVLIFALGFSFLWISSPFGSTKASAGTYKGGFMVTASKADDSGIALDTDFYVTSRTPVTLDYLKENLSIRGEPAPEISQLPDGRFLVRPAGKLEKGRLYVIDINTPGGQTVSFAFQTPRDFAVAGSLPQDMSVNVPVDTGIEVYFTYPDVKDFDRYFEIYPKTEGRFEEHGYARCFIPKKLEPGTVYTVTVKKGLRAANGTLVLEQDYTFSFETSPDESLTADPSPGSLWITDSWFDFSTRENPVIPFYLYLPAAKDIQKSVQVRTAVYRFPSEDALIKAVRELEQVPYWAQYSRSKVSTDVSQLEKVMEFTQDFSTDLRGSSYIMLPESLPHGFYVIVLECGELRAQAFIQSSDISAFFIEDSSIGLFWVNDLATGQAAVSAVVEDPQTGRTAKTDVNGLARIIGTSTGRDPARMEIYRIKTADGRVSLLNAGYPYVSYGDEYDTIGLYWRYLQTDRTLYKPDDLVQLWGFAKSRVDNRTPARVTVELSESRYFRPVYGGYAKSIIPFFTGKPLVSVDLDVKDGFFGGKIKLPYLDPGSYNLAVRCDDRIIASSYIRVENYVKPQYLLDVTSDKKAVFAGEKIKFTIMASFFDGTPVSNVPVRYSIAGYMDVKTGEGITDRNGILTVEYIPEYRNGMQGANYYGFSATAALPESGEIRQYCDFRVYANHTELVADGEIDGGKATVSITAHRVELDTINDDDPDNDRHLGQKVPGHEAEVRIYHVTWDRIETGEDYDFVNKVVRKLYEYRERKTPVTVKKLVTGSDGKASFSFPAEKNTEGYYVAEVTSQDEKGRPLKYQVSFRDLNRSYYSPAVSDYYYLKSDKESYGSGETVNIGFYRGEEPVKGFRTLFVEARNGIIGAEVKDQPVYTKPFDAALSPNYYVVGVMLANTAYIRSSCWVSFSYEEKRLSVDLKTDKDSYRPGEACTVTITATDSDGRPVAAVVNVSMIDEALLQLSGQDIDPLEQLHSWIGSGIRRYSDSRINSPMYPERSEGGGIIVADQKAEADLIPDDAAASGESLRSDFRDTACFETIRLDENGKGTLTFTLPDSVTSFRLAAAAISTDLQAGSEIITKRVSMPFFISDTMSLTYLSGDKPYIGVTAYGQELSEDEKVVFEIRAEGLDSYVETATAKAFERVYIPLPALSEGTYDIEIYARSEKGLTDGIRRTIRVFRTYRTMEKASSKDLVPGVQIDAGTSGLTTIIVANRGRGKLIDEFHGLAFGYGNRLDQKLTAYVARKTLNGLLSPGEPVYEPEVPDVLNYRNADGGYGILPYASSDIRMSALLAPWLAEITDTASLRMYFYKALLSGETVNAAALYGLAALGEPVMVELEMARNTENLSLTDYMLVGMAYRMLGETGTALEIYNTRIRPHLEEMGPYIRVRVMDGDFDTSLGQTALLAAYAAGLGLEDADKMYAYVAAKNSGNVYTGVESLVYLTEKLKNTPASSETLEFEYTFGGRSYHVKLENGQCEVIRIPSSKAGEFRVTSVKGSALLISVYEAPLATDTENDGNVSIERRYFNAITGEETAAFRPGDIVKIQIDYKIRDEAMDDVYEITDFAPSGLAPVASAWSYGITGDSGWHYRDIDGQKVTFVVRKTTDAAGDYKPLVYYARVVAPGEYTAEGTVAQGSIVKPSLTVNENEVVRILP